MPALTSYVVSDSAWRRDRRNHAVQSAFPVEEPFAAALAQWRGMVVGDQFLDVSDDQPASARPSARSCSSPPRKKRGSKGSPADK